MIQTAKLKASSEPVERALIGAIIQRPGLIGEIAELDTFHFTAIPTIAVFVWDHITATGSAGASVIAHEAEKQKVCTRDEIYTCCALADFEAVHEHAAKIVENWQRIREIEIRLQVAEALLSGRDLKESLDDEVALREMIAPAQDVILQRNKLYEAFVDEIGRKMRGEVPSGFGLPWRKVQQRTGSFVPSRLMIIGARPGMGKTTCTMQMIDYISLQCPALFISLEMSFKEVTGKLVQANTGIARDRLESGDITPSAFADVYEHVGRLHDRNLHIVDDAMTLGKISATVRKYARTHGVKVVFIDYLQLISDPSQRHQNENVEVGHISRTLKLLAKSEGVQIVCLSQLSRAVETRGGDKRPLLSDLRSSGSIEQDADVIAFLYRAAYYGIVQDADGQSTEGVTEFIVAKNRHNSRGVGVVRLFHNPITDTLHEDEQEQSGALQDDKPYQYSPIVAQALPDKIPF